ncbi:MAG: cupin domain-containing protein [candidate division Zixibacteria bacterium]|nr:cupin domain-containing protein [candidate division Zixibacteria bacterium]
MNSIDINNNDIEWADALNYPQGAKEKVLFVGSDMAPRTILLKIPPGWRMDSHSHSHTELHHVLEGEYESQGKVYPSGTFRIIPKEVEHGPFTTKAGATILVVWCVLKE